MLGKVLLVSFEQGAIMTGVSEMFDHAKEINIENLEDAYKEYQPSVTVFFHPLYERLHLHLDSISKIGGHKILYDLECPWELDWIVKFHQYFGIVLTHDLASVNYLKGVIGDKVHHIPHAVSSGYYPMTVPYEFRSDICFVGGAYPSRLRFFREVLPHLKDYMVTIVGVGWEFLPDVENQRIINTGCSNYDYMRYTNGAKINVNLHRLSTELVAANEDHVEASSPNNRFFEIASTDSFQLIDSDRMPEIQSYYDTTLPRFSDPEDFIEKAVYYLNHKEERMEIAEKLYQETMEKHTYMKRMQLIADLI